ncbi:hypothetical protein [Streptomyces minutiscleroticus]|uniref:hypothetical protein n=1 Tax=Streptomyces minutiscleroticus TaxID=68238 RepID=UPI00167F103D|nr:hypothetical protein [Streptomyces minutiscleroticus]
MDEQGDLPRDTGMREDGATSTAALLIWERRELHDPQEPRSPHVRASMINRPNPERRDSLGALLFTVPDYANHLIKKGHRETPEYPASGGLLTADS